VDAPIELRERVALRDRDAVDGHDAIAAANAGAHRRTVRIRHQHAARPEGRRAAAHVADEKDAGPAALVPLPQQADRPCRSRRQKDGGESQTDGDPARRAHDSCLRSCRLPVSS